MNKTSTHSRPASQENYTSLNGLRAYAIIGIVLMHVLTNMPDKPDWGFATGQLIPWFTNFTLLFMMVSAFSMCCGYYERIRTGEITPTAFYAKRYRRIWPFFALMVAISFGMEPGWDTFCQSFANLTLCFNLLPNPEIQIVGVGWFLGTIFTFYMLFPFFTFLLDHKKKGWIVLLLSLFFCYIAIHYFSSPEYVVKPIGRTNILYSAPFFLAGGLIYLYRRTFLQHPAAYSLTAGTICLVLTILKFRFPSDTLFILPDLAIFATLLIYAIPSKDAVLNNRIAKYISSIGLEIYLCHMMFYRAVEMLPLHRFIENPGTRYIAYSILTLAGAIAFAHGIKFHLFPYIGKRIGHTHTK